MLIDPEKVTLRVGATDASYLNIDYDGKEIGYIKLHADGSYAWAHDVSDKPIVLLVERCLALG
jgi:hypothetical protein